MNVNQHAPMASQYGQPHSGYGQQSYAPLDGGYPASYAPYNGPASAYQPGAPQQGMGLSLMPCVVLLPASRCFHVRVSAPLYLILTLCRVCISSNCSFHLLPFPSVGILSSFLIFQVILLSQASPLRLWQPPQSLTCPLPLTWVTASSPSSSHVWANIRVVAAILLPQKNLFLFHYKVLHSTSALLGS